MGKGDKKSKRGKIFKGSYGISRPRKVVHAAPAPALKAEAKAKTEKPKTATRTRAKKTEAPAAE